MDVNDNACFLNKRGALESIASKLAPTQSNYHPRRLGDSTNLRTACPLLP